MNGNSESRVWKYLGPVAIAAMLGLAPVLFFMFQGVVMRDYLEKRLEPLETHIKTLQANHQRIELEQAQWKILDSRLTIFQEELHAIRMYLVEQARERDREMQREREREWRRDQEQPQK